MKTWRYLWHLLGYRPGLYLLNLLAIVVHFLFDLAPGVLTRDYFNLLEGKGQVQFSLITIVALFLVAFLGRVTTNFCLGLTNIPFILEVGGLLRKNLFARMIAVPGGQPGSHSSGEAISRYRDDVEEIVGSFMWFNDLQALTLFSVIALAIMLRTNAAITLCVFIPLVVVVSLANLVGKRITANRKASREAAGNVTSFLGESLGAVGAIQVAGAEEQVVAHFRKINETRRKAAVRDRLFNAMMESIFRNAISLGTGLVLILAGRAMRSGAFTVGDFALFVYFLGTITEFTGMMGAFIAHYRQMGVSFGRMVELMAGASPSELVQHGPVYMSRRDGEPPPLPVLTRTNADKLETLESQNLTYRYPDSENGITDVSLSIWRGAFVVITGRIGSGKTTLLRALLGLVEPNAGDIRWNGATVNDPGAWFVPPRCAYTPQVPRLFSETLRDNILLGLTLPDEQTDTVLKAAIDAAVLESDIASMTEGLETKIGPRGVRLSGGQSQRTASARMFVREPSLLVCDDLSSALDVETERVLWERVFARPDATCLVVSHRRAVLRRADHIIVMKEGRVDSEGRLDDLLQSSEEMRRLWHGDFGTASPAIRHHEPALATS